MYVLQKRIPLAAAHLLLIATLCFTLSSHASDTLYSNGDSDTDINITVTDDRYSLYAQQAKLSDILYKLGKAADFELKLFENLGSEKSDWKYESASLIQLLNNLLRDFNTIMLYEERPDGKHGATNRKLKELWLIASDDGKAPARPEPKNIEIKLNQPETTNKQLQTLTAEQQSEISHIDNLEGLTSDDVIETLKQTLLTESDPVIRKRAVTALGDIGGTRVLGALESGLGDDSSLVRIELANTFADIHDQRSVLALGQMVFGDHDPKVRQQAIRALAKQESPVARSFIKTALKDSEVSVQKVAREMLH